jgi:hypothetical protein
MLVLLVRHHNLRYHLPEGFLQTLLVPVVSTVIFVYDVSQSNQYVQVLANHNPTTQVHQFLPLHNVTVAVHNYPVVVMLVVASFPHGCIRRKVTGNLVL